MLSFGRLEVGGAVAEEPAEEMGSEKTMRMGNEDGAGAGSEWTATSTRVPWDIVAAAEGDAALGKIFADGDFS